MRDYLASLERLTHLHLDRIFPGHFRPLDGGRKIIEGYIEHRRAREAAIVDALRAGSRTVPDIVERVYADTPPALHPIARYSVQAHLEKLEEESAARCTDNRWELTSLE
jgi:glyoxylase-like metal-dependent hydrolase (beta-lactamase superfamily II)